MGTSLTTQLVGMIIVSILCPFIGTFIVTGCGVDGLITFVGCCLGYIPGLAHALFVVITWYRRCQMRQNGILPDKKAVFIFSGRVHQGIPLSRSTPIKDGRVVEPVEKGKKTLAVGLATAPVPATAGDTMV